MKDEKITLKYSSGNVISPSVHEVGLIALGSHRENHGSMLPIDTDSKIAANVTLKVATDTGATYLGIFYAATEYDYVKHGIHMEYKKLIEDQIIPQLNNIRETLGIKKVIIVNGHGGNNIIIPEIDYISQMTSLEIKFNNSIIENEGAHACTGELSMGQILGITDDTKFSQHNDFKKNPEVGMVGLKLARKNNSIIDKQAQDIEAHGFKIDKNFGQELLDNAYKSIVQDVEDLLG